MGVQQRTAIQYAGYGLDERQPMDALPYAGFLDTINGSRVAVSDSAAGATAWSIGVKTRNGLVGLGKDKVRVPTLLEIAEDQGKATGIVNDHDITNATLASFAAPIVNRDWKVAIAQRTLRNISPDVMMGGGEGYWYPRGHKGMIPNKVPDEDKSIGEDNLVEEAIDDGYQYAYDRETVDDLTGPKALALVQDSGLQRYKELKGYKPNEDPYYVKHQVLFAKALEILSQDPDGFFLVTESDDMDSAAHEHDGQNVIKTGMNINRIVEIVEEFRQTHPDVLLVVTADHETGGMTIENTSETNTNSDGDDPVPVLRRRLEEQRRAQRPGSAEERAVRDQGHGPRVQGGLDDPRAHGRLRPGDRQRTPRRGVHGRPPQHSRVRRDQRGAHHPVTRAPQRAPAATPIPRPRGRRSVFPEPYLGASRL